MIGMNKLFKISNHAMAVYQQHMTGTGKNEASINILPYTWEAFAGYTVQSDICKIFYTVKFDDFQSVVKYLNGRYHRYEWETQSDCGSLW